MQTSSTVAAIAAALAKAQKVIKPAVFDRTNPHFKNKYATLPAIVEAARAALADNGIAVLQGAEAEGAVVKVTTRLAHSSGEWIESTLSMTAQQNTPQGIMSTLTYCRRGSLASLVCIVADEDDDGEIASKPAHQPQREEPAKPKARSIDDRKLAIVAELKSLGFEPAGIAHFVKDALGKDKATTHDDLDRLDAALVLTRANKTADKQNDLNY